MSLRIVTEKDGTTTTLTVSGRLVGPWIPELVRAFDETGSDGSVVVDISDVSFVAADGVEVLRGLMHRGATVHGCPAYLVPQLWESES